MKYNIYIRTYDGAELWIHTTDVVGDASDTARQLLFLDNVLEVKIEKKESE
jgi:uncharacterized protein (DUF2225 family)